MHIDVIVIFHGLGNQMSQYAFYLQRKLLTKKVYIISFGNDHNGFELDRVFGISEKVGFKHRILYCIFRILLTDKGIIRPLVWLLKLVNCKIVKEGHDYRFKETLIKPSRGITFYYGGWHNEKYFSGVEKEIKQAFKFKLPEDDCNKNCLIKITTTDSIAIHVRRGDYLNLANINLFGDICGDAYYKKAIQYIEKGVSDPHFFIFSNDPDWVTKNLKLKNMTIIECNLGNDSWKDMCLMSLCKHNIVANSTFSWWGAWLNKHPEKYVVAPDRFINADVDSDIYPSSWVKLS